VAEVIGTILTLSITVVLFSSIILMVDEFPAPGDNVYTDFIATIEPWNGDWNNGAFVHITNTGGQLMTGMWTLIVISIDSQTFTLRTKGTMPDDGRTYGLGPMVAGHRGNDNGDDNWDTGERWTLPRNETCISQGSDVSVIILDEGRNALVWSAKIQGDRNSFGPIITNVVVDSDLESIRQEPIQFGRQFYIFADVYDPDGDLDTDSVYADLSSIGLSNNVTMYHLGDGLYRSGPVMGPNVGSVPLGYHIVVIHATDFSGMHSRTTGRIAVGLDLKGQPNLVLNSRNLKLSSDTPTNRQTITITVTVVNYGGSCNGTLSITDIIDSTERLIATENFTISDGPDQVTKIIKWTVGPGGGHTLRIEAWPVNAIDADPLDNIAFLNLTVMPTILLVDDDNHPADYSYMDVASYMKGALDSCDFRYDIHVVGTAKSGPAYTFGERKLSNYDIIIWMTGYEYTTTLTSADRVNLTAYLNDDLGTGRAGSLWLIGQSLFNDVPTAFFEDVLKVENGFGAPTLMGDELMGVDGNPISYEWDTSFISMTNRHPSGDPNYEKSWAIQPRSGAEVTFNQDIVEPLIGHALNYENSALDSRLVFFPWEFSRIKDTGDQAGVTFRVMNWLGNLGNRIGEDLAISEQALFPSFVFFNQKVTVTAVIRNNGPTNLTAEAGLFLDGGNVPVAWYPSVVVLANGGTATVNGTWNATLLGTHILKWKVDPNGLIAESNENNNEVPSHVHSGEVFVEFRILVVDDDASSNNVNSTGIPANDTAYLTESLNRLGYIYEYTYIENTTYEVPVGEDGPPIEVLKDYSAVFWVGGNSTAALTNLDAYNLEQYLLNNAGRLWLSGNDMYSGLSAGNRTTLLNTLGLSNVTVDQPISGTMRGVDDNPISHGMNISIANNPYADMLIPVTVDNGVFYRSYIAHTFTAVMYEESSYHAFTNGFSLGTLYGSDTEYIAGNNATDELTYLLLRWAGRPETRSEVRVTERDYFLQNPHPQIGGAYVMRTKVHNVGANNANALVRFMDGTVQIGSDTISITPGSSTSAEIIWTPLFAGQRIIGILVDPVNEVDEIFQWFNNNITFDTYVYFFWDDMESGTSKWTHASTLMNINGEGPLDFLTASYTTVNTNVIGTWDWSRTSGVVNTTAQYHSHPNSFYMEEPQGYFGVLADVLVAIVLDNSPSMTDRICPDGTGRTYLEVAQDAAAAMVNEFSNDSAVGVYDFKGANENVLIGITSLAGTGRQTVIDAIYANLDQGNTNTAIWDTIGMGYEAVNAAKPLYPNNYAAVVSLGDGFDIQASDTSAYGFMKLEAGSDKWAPWGNMYPELGYPNTNYPNHWGKYWHYKDALPGEWVNSGTHGGAFMNNRKGLVNSDIPIYTIGLALEHYNPPYASPVTPVPPEYTRDLRTHVTNTESGTVEYNFWRIANTSKAEYFYSEDGSNLEDIFKQIGRIIAAGGFNQTRSSTPAPETRDDDNMDKKAVSPAFDLSEYESATFSFWHKYNMLSGGNGGIVGVELWDPNPAPGSWKFLYIIPPGAYTGGIYFDYNIYDDFGNVIKWCFNGISGRNTFSWDHISVDVMPFIETLGLQRTGNPDYFKGNVRMAMKYMQFGGGTGVGWYIDDVKLDVSRADTNPNNLTADAWRLTSADWSYGPLGWNHSAHSGNYAWWNGDTATGYVRTGLDNSLITNPIDLTNAKAAYLSAYFKFNLNEVQGSPPDGFRVEISSDDGVTWKTLNLGVRTAWGVSGTGLYASDGIYTGIGDSGEGNYLTDGYWVGAGSLSRLNIDVTPWVGNQILIRFRTVTNNLPAASYPHNNNLHFSDPGFGGFYIDDVVVYGETLFG